MSTIIEKQIPIKPNGLFVKLKYNQFYVDIRQNLGAITYSVGGGSSKNEVMNNFAFLLGKMLKENPDKTFSSTEFKNFFEPFFVELMTIDTRLIRKETSLFVKGRTEELREMFNDFVEDKHTYSKIIQEPLFDIPKPVSVNLTEKFGKLSQTLNKLKSCSYISHTAAYDDVSKTLDVLIKKYTDEYEIYGELDALEGYTDEQKLLFIQMKQDIKNKASK